MMPPESIAALAQLGAAGLIGWLWLVERRSAVDRERELREAHAALVDERRQVDVLVRVVEANTRALAAVEAGQRELAGVIRHAQAGAEARISSAGHSDRPFVIAEARA